MRDRRLVVLAAVGVLALVAGGVLAWLTFRGDEEQTARAQASPSLQTRPLVSRKGGFSLRVPEGLRAKRNGRVVRLTSSDHELIVSVGPVSGGQLRAASRAFERQLRATYRGVNVLGRRSDRVDERAALTTYGRARGTGKVRLRFVVVHVKARPSNYAITVFTAAGSDPRRVLPVVNEVAGSFHVLGRGKPKK